MIEYELDVPGLGSYIVCACVTKLSDDDCHVGILNAAKWQEEQQEYVEHTLDDVEKNKLTKEFAIEYFRNLQ